MAALLCSLTLCQARQHWPCHQRAIHSGLKRSPADTHGQPRSSLDLRRSPPSQVTSLRDLALQAGGRGFESHHLHHHHPRSAPTSSAAPWTL